MTKSGNLEDIEIPSASGVIMSHYQNGIKELIVKYRDSIKSPSGSSSEFKKGHDNALSEITDDLVALIAGEFAVEVAQVLEEGEKV